MWVVWKKAGGDCLEEGDKSWAISSLGRNGVGAIKVSAEGGNAVVFLLIFEE